MSDNKRKILEMLAQNKITADDAYRLLNAIDGGEGRRENSSKGATAVKDKAKYLRVTVLPGPESDRSGKCDRVNIRVPMSLIRAGIKFTSLIPSEARDKINLALHEKGIDIDERNMKPEDIEELIGALGDLEIDVVGKNGETVKVFVE
ncbi:MAG: hypothetical protein QUS33_00830 [Dehalococcoidia bacterium]|nr:hypothetical protein [Dehalococcoidia bacterium]